HHVDVLVPVHVPDPRAAPAPHELRVGGARGGLVAVHPAGDHGPGLLPQLLVSAALIGGWRAHPIRSLIRPATAGCVWLKKSSTWARRSIPASEPRPVATRDPQAMPSQAASAGAAPRRSPASMPAVKPSPQPVVSTTSTARAGRASGVRIRSWRVAT